MPVIRFEREGEARLARWLGADDWQHRPVLDKLSRAPPSIRPWPVTGRPDAPLTMRLRWIQEVADMGPDALELFEQQTFREWDRASLDAVRRAIDARRTELARE